MTDTMFRAPERIRAATGRPGVTLMVACVCQFVIAIDYNIVFVALPSIGTDLGLHDAGLQWVVTAYTVAVGGILLLGGRLSDRIGARRILASGMATYAAGCLVSAIGASAPLLIAGRFVQGLGAGVATPASLAVIYAAFRGSTERHRALGSWGAATAFGLAAGSAVGGILTGVWGWSSVFWVTAAMAASSALLATIALPRDSAARWHDFDVPGAVLATVASVAVIFGLAEIPTSGMLSVESGGVIVAGIAVAGLWMWWESRAHSPLLPIAVVTDRSFLGVAAALIAAQGTLGAGYFVYTTYLQRQLGWGAVAAGMAFLPLAAVSIVLARRAVPAVMNRFGPGTTVLGCFALSILSFIPLGVAYAMHAPFAVVLTVMLVWAVACAFLFPAAMALLGHIPIADAFPGVTSAAGSSARQIGAGIGLAVVIIASGVGTGVNADLAACLAIALFCVVGVIGALVAVREQKGESA